MWSFHTACRLQIMAAWASVPAQLSKENRKFQYKVVKSGARAYEYETPLDWLKFAGIINKCVRITEGKFPNQKERDAFFL
jgi:hypothetical protein